MTIKTTLAYGRNFHFYQEGLSNNYVYLELEDAPYDAGYRRIMIAIPIDIWEAIRPLGAARLELAASSDEELLHIVKTKVEERITTYHRIRSSNIEQAEIYRFDNSLIFGAADENREQQIDRGMGYYRTERERQRGIANRMAQHKIIDIDVETNNDQETKI